MSEWYKIEDIENIEISDDGLSLEIYFNQNYFGAQYVEVPIEFIKKVLENENKLDTLSTGKD